MKKLFLLGCFLGSFAVLAQQGVRVYDYKNQWNSDDAILNVGIYSGSAIPNNLDDRISSIKVFPGYQVVFSENADGTGYSKTYIAKVGQLNQNLPDELHNKVSYIRVLAASIASKKGVGKTEGTGGVNYALDMNASWYYNWTADGTTTTSVEFVPMVHTWTGASVFNKIDSLGDDVSHLLGFNEPDNVNEAGIRSVLKNPVTAVGEYEKLLKTGLRLGSPVTTQNYDLNDQWLEPFLDEAYDLQVKVDYIAVHWYDWDGDPKNSRDANPDHIFNRFKADIQAIHNKYGLPIWVTEFNANPWRYTYVQKGFMEKALPWLEAQDYIERFAWFECFEVDGVKARCNLKEDGNLTTLGQYYSAHASNAAIPEDNWVDPVLLSGSNVNGSARITEFIEKEFNPEKISIQVVPNPVKDWLNITGISSDTAIEVYNLQGQLQLKQTGSSVNVANLTPGIYFVKFGNQVSKFVK